MMLWAPASAQQAEPPVVSVQPVPSATIHLATIPAVIPVIAPPPAPAAPPPVLGAEISGKLKADERHFNEKSASARLDFDLRQAEERKSFEAAPPGSGFWERRGLARAFRAEQKRRRREFLAEQEQKRKTYEWRYP